MTKALVFAFAVLLFAFAASAQERKATYSKFKRSEAITADDQLDKAAKLLKKDPGAALTLVKGALASSIAQDDAFSEGRAYVMLGSINEDIQEWRLAADNYEQAYDKLKRDNAGSIEFRQALSGLGRSNLKLKNFEQALQNFQEVLTIAKSNAEADEIRLHISEAHFGLGQYDASLKDLGTEEKKKPVPGSSSFGARVSNQKARIYAQTDKLADSRAFYSNSISRSKSDTLNDDSKQSFDVAKEEIAGALRAQNKADEEIQLRSNSIQFNRAQNNLEEVSKDQVEIAKTLDASGKTGAAVTQNELAAELADSINNPVAKANAFNNLARLYEKTGRKDKAINAWHKYSDAIGKRDSSQQEALLRKADLIQKQRDIEEISKQVELGKGDASFEHAMYLRQQLIIYGLLILLVVIAVTSWFIYRNAQASKRANQLLALKSLRSQMNPHFIFNALNSVNHFIAEEDERSANRFLSEFSQLMRLVLENSQLDFIPLHKEQEILALYLKLEHYRFRDKFEYQIETDDSIPAELVAVPPMLIQPYIENAVWHGLRYKQTPGMLNLRFRKEPGFIVAEITDNGIGRRRSQELKTENQKKHNSTGLKNIEERIVMINKLYRTSYRIEIDDLINGAGTKVTVYMPLANTIKEAV